jgi:hypothetical protein
MSKEFKVVVEGGGRNLYKITEYNGTYHAYQVTVNLLSNSNDSIGKANSLDVALALIRSHSGEDIEKITEI